MCSIPQSGCWRSLVSLAAKAFLGKGTDHVEGIGAKHLPQRARHTRLTVWIKANYSLHWIRACKVCAGHSLAEWSVMMEFSSDFTLHLNQETILLSQEETSVCKLPLQTLANQKRRDYIVKPYKPSSSQSTEVAGWGEKDLKSCSSLLSQICSP